MQIDWFTVVAQVVNFLVLVFLLRRFLYAPVLEAMEARERCVAEELERAEAAHAEARTEAERLRRANAELEHGRDALVAAARAEAEERRRTLVGEAREEAARLRRRWREAVERERQAFLDELEQRVGHEVQAIAARVLRSLAGEDLERRMAECFLERLERTPQLWHDARAEREEDRPRVTSAFPLDADLRARLAAALARGLGRSVEPEFVEDGDALCGLEVRLGGRKVSWSVREHLASLSELFEREVGGRERVGA